ncbi:MAG: phenylacetate--CoA ligase [bacterium]|nr:phenylacetate--CoA ligase [bacterium]
MPMWEKEYESMDRTDLEQLQLERLQATLNRAYRSVRFYNQLFDQAGILPEEIKTMDDLARIPFTRKSALRDNYPYGMFAVPLREVVRIHSSSGTSGKPTVVGYTRGDLVNWSNLVARILVAAGVSSEDVIQIAFGYGLFTGAFGLHYGVERLGASVIPVSSGNTEKQIMIMKDYRTTVLVCTPSYALHIAEVMKEMGVHPNELSLKIGCFGAEAWSEGIRKKIEESLYIRATDNYGLSEIIGPGVAGECQYKCGLHIQEDHFIAEIINPDTGERLPLGEEGELVLTTITKEALPMIRYRTGDITRLLTDPCPCGRTFVRMARVSGRTDDMLIIRGVNVFPSQIEYILLEEEGAEPHYQLIVDREGALDTLEVRLEVSDKIFYDEMKLQQEFQNRIQKKISSLLGLNVKVTLVEPRTLERTTGKARRVIDNRKL